jgi:3-phenylpropionate/cinnamic acid dioxygenase small subunit
MLSSVAISRAEIEAFLFTEARFADAGDYDAWLSLWTDDALYWIPANRDDYDPNEHVSIVYADRERLQDRIDRLKSGGAWAQEPMSRACRLISNVEVEGSDKNDEITVRSNFALGELRRGRQTIYFAHQIHRLRPTAAGLRMSYKKVMLINNDEPIHNLSFLV